MLPVFVSDGFWVLGVLFGWSLAGWGRGAGRFRRHAGYGIPSPAWRHEHAPNLSLCAIAALCPCCCRTVLCHALQCWHPPCVCGGPRPAAGGSGHHDRCAAAIVKCMQQGVGLPSSSFHAPLARRTSRCGARFIGRSLMLLSVGWLCS